MTDNLALACIHCSLRKGARQRGRDPKTGKLVAIFHPRKLPWNHHFRWSGNRLLGIVALALNSPEHLIIRSFEARLGRHPPPGHA